MTYPWDSEPTVAPSGFDPFATEVAMPMTVRDASTRVRAPSMGGSVTRPVRRNLLEMGLACGQGADALQAKAVQAEAVQREADRAAGVEREAPENEPVDAEADCRAPDPAAITAMATEVQAIGRKRERLAEELAGLDCEQADLQRKLMQALATAGVRSGRTGPAPPALPAAEYFPKAAWR